MRAIVVMFDSLNRKYVAPYAGQEAPRTPNFERLAAHAATFDNCYAGSMPCMPARRELHTGRYNFLHRSWGPLEPFDDSVPAMLGKAGITTHLATDHMHYWEDGGATYHTRYGTFSLVRGQQGDPWKGRVADPQVPESLRVRRSGTWRQDRINREYFRGLEDHPQTLTFDAGLEFIADNRNEQEWFVQIETFDPHEPFFSDPSFQERTEGSEGPDCDWPDYMQVIDDESVVRRVTNSYRDLVRMSDASLGRVLDAMDEHALWDDTMLIVCTDHGFLLGEQGWWGKSVPPWYDETIHTPFYVWDPRVGISGERRDSLVQTIDIGPTLLDFFGVAMTPDMQGRPLLNTVASDEPVREHALFGAFGGHVSITDGRYVYMRAPKEASNAPLLEHTLMPAHMRGLFTAAELGLARLHPPFGFTKGMPLLQTPGRAMTNPSAFGTQLFDLQADPRQEHLLLDDEIELSMVRALVEQMRANESPESQYQRLGLPMTEEPGTEHLLARLQHHQALAAREPAPPLSDFPDSALSVRSTVARLLGDPRAAKVIRRHCGPVVVGPFAEICGEISLYRAASLMVGVLPWQSLRQIAAELAEIEITPDTTTHP